MAFNPEVALFNLLEDAQTAVIFGQRRRSQSEFDELDDWPEVARNCAGIDRSDIACWTCGEVRQRRFTAR